MVGFLRTGSRDLTNSAAYPPAFGREVAKLHSESMALWMQLGVLQNNDNVVCEAIQFVTTSKYQTWIVHAISSRLMQYDFN